MRVNIAKAIKSIKGEIDFFQPLYEAIVNAFQADAKKIDINFKLNGDDTIKQYSVKDDGVGFIDVKIEAFLELWSDYNIEKGALGSGRILCLKVFNNILIESQTKDSANQTGQLVNIDFNKNFIPNVLKDINKTPKTSHSSWTITKFENIILSENQHKLFLISTIQEKIFIELLPMFIKFGEKGKSFSIKINNKLWIDDNLLEERLTEYSFEKKTFNIKDEEFKLTYRIKEDNKKQLEQFYGASDRNIMRFPKKTRIQKIDNKYSGIFCLTAKYLNKRVLDSRNGFTLRPDQNNSSTEHPITFKNINDKLGELLNSILRESFENIDNDFNNNKNNIIEKLPHLAGYMNGINNLTLPESSIIKLAEKNFINKRKDIKAQVEKFTVDCATSGFNKNKFDEIRGDFTIVGKEVLADYIGYRQTIIEMLLEVSPKNLESDIHNLFMPQYTTSNDDNKYANNVWIFDDKFMNYNYAASDVTIKKIANDVNRTETVVSGTGKDDKPDLIMFYSDKPDGYKDVLLIEFKKLGVTTSEKEKAINQLNKYPMYIKDHVANIGNIYTYAIIDFDDKFIKILKEANGFVDNAFGDAENKISAYYKYNSTVKAHINVVSFLQVLNDANKRNKAFLDILINKFKDGNFTK